MNLVTPAISGFAPPTADGFVVTTVQVQGENFEPGTSVVFGSQSPAPQNLTPTSFDVDVGPQAEGTANVEVTLPNGESASATFDFFLVEPVISSVVPDSAAFDEVVMVTVNGQDFLPGLTVVFLSHNPTPTNVTSTSFDAQVGPEPSGGADPLVVPVVVTNPNGKVSSPSSFVFTSFSGEPRVFLTSTRYTGDMGGIAGADAACMARAAAGSLGGQFRAWISDGVTDPASVFDTRLGPYSVVGGSDIALTWSDLTDGTLAQPIERTEFGALSGGEAWTGVAPDGTAGGGNCSGWTSTSGTGRVGGATETGSGWTDRPPEESCTLQKHLYCFEY